MEFEETKVDFRCSTYGVENYKLCKRRFYDGIQNYRIILDQPYSVWEHKDYGKVRVSWNFL